MSLAIAAGLAAVAVTAIYYFVFNHPEVSVATQHADHYSVEVAKDKDGTACGLRRPVQFSGASFSLAYFDSPPCFNRF